MFAWMLLFWCLMQVGLLQYRLRGRIRRRNNILLTVTLSRKTAKRIVVEQDDMRSIGGSSLIALLAALLAAVLVNEFRIEESFLLTYISVVSALAAIVGVMLLLWVASMFAANRSVDSASETPIVFLWKVPLAVVYTLHKLFLDYHAGKQSVEETH